MKNEEIAGRLSTLEANQQGIRGYVETILENQEKFFDRVGENEKAILTITTERKYGARMLAGFSAFLGACIAIVCEYFFHRN